MNANSKERLFLYRDEKERLKELQIFIEANLDSKLTVTTLARRCMISARTLQRQFWSFSNETIQDYIHRKRMEAAMSLIVAKMMYVNKVGNAVGYKSFPSFTKAFTKYFGHSPSYYHHVSGEN